MPSPPANRAAREHGDEEPLFASRVRAAAALPVHALRGLNPFPAKPIDLRIAGRTLFHAAIVGAIGGVLGTAFFASLELGQRVLLESWAGFAPLRAAGETVIPVHHEPVLRWWLLAILPALGALASGLLTTFLAPETAGGGGDAAIEAYHHGGNVRFRVIPVKSIAATLALASGGSGGREGPIMHIGAAVGAVVGRFLTTTASERRVLLVAGVAAGMAAVFRTPLGAALLATEMLFRDDFEADALVPAIFSSVVAYSVAIAILGETTLFGSLPRFKFTARHLPLYALLSVMVSVIAVAFVSVLRAVQRLTARLPVPVWCRPGIGGLAMGCVGTAVAVWMSHHYGSPGRGLSVFGGGYGVMQVAISGADWLPAQAVAMTLLALALLKVIASALTIGSGAAAGDFAPSLVIGGLLGSAFGHTAQLVLHDPSIHPAAFALVGMGTFYGGLAHAPLAALVLVSELAGSYDLLVPMMLAIGIAYVALRKHSLYPAQLASRLFGLDARRNGDDTTPQQQVITEYIVAAELPALDEGASLAEVTDAIVRTRRQRVAVVTNSRGPIGLIEFSVLLDVPDSERAWIKVGDAMVPFACVRADAGIHEVADILVQRGVSQVPVVRDGEFVGWIGDRELRDAHERVSTKDHQDG